MARKTKKLLEAELEAMTAGDAVKLEEEKEKKEKKKKEEEVAKDILADTDTKVELMEAMVNNMTMDLIQLGIDSEATSATKWDKTGQIIVQNKDMFEGDVNPKDFQRNFIGALDNEVIVEGLPTKGNLDRKGDPLNIIKTNGKVKWSSWNVTSRIVQNCSDIWKVLELVPFAQIFPNGKIITRYEVLQLIEKMSEPKVPETAIETILRCNELVLKKIAELELKDVDTAISSMSIIQAAISDHHDKLK